MPNVRPSNAPAASAERRYAAAMARVRTRGSSARLWPWFTLTTAVVIACSSVPDVTFVDGGPDADDDPGPSSSSGGSSGSSSGAAPSCTPVREGPGSVCCGAIQCVGRDCGDCGWCQSQCNQPGKKYCCLNAGEQHCLNRDEDCFEKTD